MAFILGECCTHWRIATYIVQVYNGEGVEHNNMHAGKISRNPGKHF